MHGEIGGGARHLTVEDVAAYADRGLAAAERARVEAHLAACAECRAEVVAVARLSRSFARRRRWAQPPCWCCSSRRGRACEITLGRCCASPPSRRRWPPR